MDALFRQPAGDPPANSISVSQLSRDSVAPSRRSRRYLAFLVLPVLFLHWGCGQKNSGPPPRYAFVDFENLSGDSSLDWMSRGASEFLSRSLRVAMGNVLSPDAIARTSQTLGPRPAGAGAAAARTGAMIAGANHIVTGYIEHTAAGVRITASEEDVPTHKTVRNMSATATSPYDALKLLARQFSAQAAPPATSNPEAFRLYCAALLGAASDAPPLLGRAVALDPGFGPAWVVLARIFVVLGDRGRAADSIQQARAQKIAPLDRAWLDFEDAGLSGDRSASLAALRKVSGLDSADAGLTRSLATAETNAGNFSQAAVVWKKLTATTPEDADAWNQLGYTLSWSGDYTGALAALREYARLRPNEPNPLDSQGDVHYWFGKFADAAASYSAAYAKLPAFLNGGELYKAAWAKFLAGDKTGADALIGKFRETREKANDPVIGLLYGDWLYRTGHPEQARALLLEALKKGVSEVKDARDVAATPPAIHTAIAAQLALWDLLGGNRPAAAKDMADGGTSNFTPADLVVRFAALPSASPAEWEARANHDLAAPQLAGIRLTSLGYALILDGGKQAAIPVWEQIVKQSPGTDFFSRRILARLKGQPADHASPPDPANLNQFAAVLDKLSPAK